MKEIRTEIEIKASTQKVWDVLVNNEEYSKWNPFITNSSGKIETGKIISNEMKNGSKTFRFNPKIEVCIAHQKLEWIGHLALSGLFDGHHSFELIPITKSKTKLIHREQFTGILVPLMFGKIANDTKKGFILMNKALKKQCEIELQAS